MRKYNGTTTFIPCTTVKSGLSLSPCVSSNLRSFVELPDDMPVKEAVIVAKRKATIHAKSVLNVEGADCCTVLFWIKGIMYSRTLFKSGRICDWEAEASDIYPANPYSPF